MRKRSSVRSGKKSFKRLFAGVILILIICVSFGAFFVSAHEKAGTDPGARGPAPQKAHGGRH